MMTILVTGGLGHIGSALIRSLPRRFPKARILILDSLLSSRYCSLFGLPPEGDYTFVEADVCTDTLDDWLVEADVVVHLAAITDAAGSFGNEERVEAVNLVGTERVAKACARAGTPMVFLSTTSVYGTQNDVVDEDASEAELKPQSPYAESKLAAERRITELSATGLRFVTLRFGTIVGPSPGMRFHTAVNKFCWQAALGQALTVWQNALDQRRPYLDLEDAIDALEFVIAGQRYDGRVYNVLTSNTTVREIVEMIKEYVPDVKFELVETRIMNQLSYEVSRERFERLGFAFRGDIRRAIERTLAQLQGVRNGAVHLPKERGMVAH